MYSRIQRLESFQRGTEYVLTSVMIVMTGVIVSRYTLIPNQVELSGFLIALFLLTVGHLVYAAVKNIVFNSKLIRRLILRDQFFEGLWVDVVHDTPKHYAIVDIRFVDGVYHISGESYDEHANFLGNWKSTGSWATASNLRYTYRGDVQNPAVWEYDGVTEYNFIGTESMYPATFSGSYVDMTREPVKKRITGERISAATARQITRQENRKKFLLEWAETFAGSAR